MNHNFVDMGTISNTAVNQWHHLVEIWQQRLMGYYEHFIFLNHGDVTGFHVYSATCVLNTFIPNQIAIGEMQFMWQKY